MKITIWNDRGFTLFELTIVVAVIAVAVSLALPLLGKTGDADLRAAGRKLAGTFKFLYNEAVLEGVNHRLTFDLDRATYHAGRQDQGGEWHGLTRRKGGNALPGSVIIRKVEVKGRQAVTAGEIDIQIYPVGWMDETVLHLEDGKHRLTMLVSGLTGAAEIFDGHQEF